MSTAKYFYALSDTKNSRYSGDPSFADSVLPCGTVAYTNEKFEDYKAARPHAVYSELLTDEALRVLADAHDEETYIKPVGKRIDSERWWEMLEILPPCKFKTVLGVEMFHISERLTGNIVAWFANDGTNYVEFHHRTNATNEEIIAKFREALA
jgi:hypothetical protein